MAELVGQRVSLHSLTGRAELNGREGTAVSFDTASGRLGVRVDGTEKLLALKPENLKQLAAAAPASTLASAPVPAPGSIRVDVKASAMMWMTRGFRDSSAGMRHSWLIDVYRTRVDDDMKRSLPHGVVMQGASAESVTLDFLQFCRLAIAHGAVPKSSSTSKIVAAWEWPAFLAAAPAKLAKAFNPEHCRAEAYYGAEMGGSEMRALAARVYADAADGEEAAELADSILRETEEACYRDGGQAADGRPLHVLTFEDGRIFEDVGGVEPWRELLAALRQKLVIR
jgi:hypothetical protein